MSRAHGGTVGPSEVAGTNQTIARIARATLVSGGALAAATGPLLMAGRARFMRGRGLLGEVAILWRWALAVVGARSGVSTGKVVLAALCGLVALALGGAQTLAPGSSVHAATQVLHVASSLGVMVGGILLARSVLSQTQVVAAPGTIAAAAADFLAMKRIAVTGVSRKADGGHGANVVYRRLKERGYQVFAVNPNTDVVEGERAYPDLTSIPGGVEAVVIATRPTRAIGTVQECAALGIGHVWMHRGPGGGSVSPEATAWGRAHGIRVIDGGCPLMFGSCADFGHKAMRGLLTLTGNVPRNVA